MFVYMYMKWVGHSISYKKGDTVGIQVFDFLYYSLRVNSLASPTLKPEFIFTNLSWVLPCVLEILLTMYDSKRINDLRIIL